MNGKEFIKAVDLVEKEKGIDREIIFEAMENALMAAYKRNTGIQNSKVVINKKTGDIKVYSYLTVVEDDDPNDFEREDIDLDTEISLTDARKINKSLNIGDTIDTEVTPKDFGRVATSTAKQVLIQKIREAERNSILNELGDKQDEMLIGTVELEDTDNYYINLGRSNGILPKKECIPGEKIQMGSQIKVYVTKVDSNSKGLLILLSRTHYGFVKRLFELEIPEIYEGVIEIKSISRDAGSRSKVAVYSPNENIDPVGSCVGQKGIRIQNIINELNGEKIDVIEWNQDPSIYISAAILPAQVLAVDIKEEEKFAQVIVPDDQLSLAIGKAGQNARLAAKLTNWKIDIKSESQFRKMIEEMNKEEENKEE